MKKQARRNKRFNGSKKKEFEHIKYVRRVIKEEREEREQHIVCEVML